MKTILLATLFAAILAGSASVCVAPTVPAAPTYGFRDGTDTGIYRNSVGEVRYCVHGADVTREEFLAEIRAWVRL